MQLTSTQNEALEDILQLIDEKKTPILLVGDSGCGKTTILKYLSKCESDISMSYINNCPIDNWATRDLLSSLINTFESGSRIVSLFFFILKIIATIAFHLNKGKTNWQMPQKVFILLYLFNTYLRFCPRKVIILDELNFWKDDDVKILFYFFFSVKSKQVFKYLSNAPIILSVSLGYYKSIRLNKIVSLNNLHTVRVKNYTTEDIKLLSKDQSITKHIVEDFDEFKRLSLESNIAILMTIINYIKQNREKPSIQQIEGDIELIIDKYLYKELYLDKILKTTSIPSSCLRLSEIIELSNSIYQHSPDITKTIVMRAIIKKILKSSSNIIIDDNSIVEFCHQDYRNYFRPKSNEEIIKFYSTYANVLQIISPGDYKERSICYCSAQDIPNYYLYQALYILQTAAMELDESYNIGNNYHKTFIEKMLLAYDKYNHQKSRDALLVLESIDNLAVPEILLFEKEFLKFKIQMVTGNKEFFSHAICRMKSYCKNFIKEKEIVVRANLIIYLSNLYLGNNNEVEQTNQEIIANIYSLSKNNDKFQYYIYTLYRRSLMVKSIHGAYSDTKRCVEYFSRKNINTQKLYRRELFYSLINHADNCRYVGKYNEAKESIRRAWRIYKRFSQELPYITIYNNMAVTLYETKSQLAEQSILQLDNLIRDIDIYKTNESTYYIIYNNIACIYAMENQLKESLEAIDKAFIIINNAEHKIKNHYFNLLINKAVILYLIGQYEMALESIRDARYLYTYHFSSESNLKRYNLINTIVCQINHCSSYADFYAHIEKLSKKPLSHLEHPLRLWNMQYWSK